MRFGSRNLLFDGAQAQLGQVPIEQQGGSGNVTASLSSILQKQDILRTAVITATLQKQGLTRTISANAALSKARTSATALNSLLRKAVSHAALADSLLQKGVNISVSAQSMLEKRNLTLAGTINAAMQKSIALTSSLNAVLNATTSPQVTAGINALLQTLVQVNTSLDTLLAKLGVEHTASINATLLRTGITNTAQANAALSKLTTKPTSFTAVLQKVTTLNANLSAAAQKLNIQVSASVGAALGKAAVTRISSIQATLQKNQTALAAVNAALLRIVALSAQADTLTLKSSIPLTTALDGLIIVFTFGEVRNLVKPASNSNLRVKPKRKDVMVPAPDLPRAGKPQGLVKAIKQDFSKP